MLTKEYLLSVENKLESENKSVFNSPLPVLNIDFLKKMYLVGENVLQLAKIVQYTLTIINNFNACLMVFRYIYFCFPYVRI